MKKICKSIILLLVLFNMQPYLNSATLTVTSTANSGANTLRNQIAAAVPGDVIEFDITSIPSTILITSSLTISSQITIQGPNLNDGTPIVIDGSGISAQGGPIFHVSSALANGTILDNLTIQNGMGGNGTLASPNGSCGGIIASSDDVTISNCSIIGCQANGFPGSNQSVVPGIGGTGGIQLTTNINITISNCLITGCQANGGASNFLLAPSAPGGNGGTGGISLDSSQDSTINSNTIVDSCQANGGDYTKFNAIAGGNGGIGGISVAISSGNAINNVTVRACTANGGNSTGTGGNYGVGGIGGISIHQVSQSQSASNNTLDGVTIMDNQANDGTVGTAPSVALGGVSAIQITDSRNTLNIIENSIIKSNSAIGTSICSTVRLQGGTNNNSIISNTISNNQVSAGIAGILVTGSSHSNLISSNTLTDNNSTSGTQGIISIESTSILNSILSNTVHDNTPAIPITLVTGGNNDQQAPTNISAMACPCGAGGAWQLIISGMSPAAAFGGQNTILMEVYFNSNVDPELNKLIGSFQWPPNSLFSNQVFPVSYADLITYNRITLTGTNSNGTNPSSITKAPGDVWGDTSPLSNEIPFIVS